MVDFDGIRKRIFAHNPAINECSVWLHVCGSEEEPYDNTTIFIKAPSINVQVNGRCLEMIDAVVCEALQQFDEKFANVECPACGRPVHN